MKPRDRYEFGRVVIIDYLFSQQEVTFWTFYSFSFVSDMVSVSNSEINVPKNHYQFLC